VTLNARLGLNCALQTLAVLVRMLWISEQALAVSDKIVANELLFQSIGL